jgi:hypothetical protein
VCVCVCEGVCVWGGTCLGGACFGLNLPRGLAGHRHQQVGKVLKPSATANLL